MKNKENQILKQHFIKKFSWKKLKIRLDYSGNKVGKSGKKCKKQKIK